MALSARHQLFIKGILAGKTQAQAYIDAGYRARGNAAESEASQLVRKPQVAQELSRRRQVAVGAAMEAEKITAERVIAEVAKIAFGDARALTEFRRVNCRHCWGTDHREQRTDGTFRGDQEEHAVSQKKAAHLARVEGFRFEPTPFDVRGGPGFDCTRAPNPVCPECRGEGVGVTRVSDTRHLEPKAVGLFAGVKRTKDGLEVKTYSKEWALDLLAKHLGVLKGGDVHVHIIDKPTADLTPEERVAKKAMLQAKLAALTPPPEKP